MSFYLPKRDILGYCNMPDSPSHNVREPALELRGGDGFFVPPGLSAGKRQRKTTPPALVFVYLSLKDSTLPGCQS